MLPTEAFADAVAFLRLFDLRALIVTSGLCSALAVKASARIRWEDFPDIRLYISYDYTIQIFRISDSLKDQQDGTSTRTQVMATLTFANESTLADLVAAAFPNCIFEDISCFTSERILDTICRVANSVVVKGTLCHSANVRRDYSLDLVRKFRKLKVSFYLVFSLCGTDCFVKMMSTFGFFRHYNSP